VHHGLGRGEDPPRSTTDPLGPAGDAGAYSVRMIAASPWRLDGPGRRLGPRACGLQRAD